MAVHMEDNNDEVDMTLDGVIKGNLCTNPRTIESDIMDIKAMLAGVKMGKVFRDSCAKILSTNLGKEELISLIRIIIKLAMNKDKDLADALDRLNDLEAAYMQVKEDLVDITSRFEDMSSRKTKLETKYNALRQETKEIWVEFPSCPEDLIDINIKYVGDLTLNEKDIIIRDYRKKKAALERKYHINNLDGDISVPLTEILYKCPKRHGPFKDARLSMLISSRISDKYSNDSIIEERLMSRLLTNEFKLPKLENWLDDEDTNIYIRKEEPKVLTWNDMRDSLYDIHNTTSSEFIITQRKQHHNDSGARTHVSKYHEASDMFFDGFGVSRSDLNGVHIMEITTMYAKELEDFLKGLPSDLQRNHLHGTYTSLKGEALDEDMMYKVKYTVLVVTKIPYEMLSSTKAYNVRSWSIDTIEKYNPYKSYEHSEPKVETRVSLFHTKHEKPFMLFHRLDDDLIVNYTSKYDPAYSESCVVINRVVWISVSDGICRPKQMKPIIINMDDELRDVKLSKYAISETEYGLRGRLSDLERDEEILKLKLEIQKLIDKNTDDKAKAKQDIALLKSKHYAEKKSLEAARKAALDRANLIKDRSSLDSKVSNHKLERERDEVESIANDSYNKRRVMRGVAFVSIGVGAMFMLAQKGLIGGSVIAAAVALIFKSGVDDLKD